MTNQDIIKDQLTDKYEKIEQDVNVHLKGLLHSKPINYWDYIQTDALLNLQVQRTILPDEMVFLMYHQVNELLFKMILWEIDQVAKEDAITATFFETKIMRISRYFDVLTSSFTVMKDGMDIDQYNKFRFSLTPASGFQSAQYRKIEFASTETINLIDNRFRKTIDRNTPFEHAFEHLYWQAAGKDYKTGEKNYTLKVFEEKYKDEFIRFAEYYNTANHYLNIGGKVAEATGGSEWVKYMHPKYQKRIFFPELWSTEELENWGKDV
jgi:tryptophan 2,3-dioxygenase